MNFGNVFKHITVIKPSDSFCLEHDFFISEKKYRRNLIFFSEVEIDNRKSYSKSWGSEEGGGLVVLHHLFEWKHD